LFIGRNPYYLGAVNGGQYGFGHMLKPKLARGNFIALCYTTQEYRKNFEKTLPSNAVSPVKVFEPSEEEAISFARY
jgi:ATP-dependent Clp protease ATP-binding subunit ClpA